MGHACCYNTLVETKKKRVYLIFLVIISAFSLGLFGALNNTASANLAMVRIFEPDEAAVLPVIQDMVTPKANLESFLRGFVFYGYYFYGFPFFGLSGLVALPFEWAGQLSNIQALMPVLRQAVSVLPMLLGLLILVYLQDGFKSTRSIVLYLFLLIIPATLQNGLWLHPDGLIILFSSLILLLLVLDNRSLGKLFFLSAAVCGVMIATKVVGAFFFLAVGVTIFWSIYEKKVTLKRALLSSIGYLVILVLFFVLANPFLLSSWARTEYISVARKQADLLATGYGVVYEKGLISSLPTLRHYYGELIFLITTLALTVMGLFNGQRRFLSALILSWFFPLTVYIFFFGHFKYQYWLPVALPMISSWVVAFPDRKSWANLKTSAKIVFVVFMAIFTLQSAFFISKDIITITKHLARESTSPSIMFYEKVNQKLGPVMNQPLMVYFDYRLYVPDDNNWQKQTSFELLTYNYIREGNFDLLLLQQQRIYDYLQDGLTAVDANEFELSQLFYRDADAGTIEGYNLIYRDSTGLVFEKNP